MGRQEYLQHQKSKSPQSIRISEIQSCDAAKLDEHNLFHQRVAVSVFFTRIITFEKSALHEEYGRSEETPYLKRSRTFADPSPEQVLSYQA